MRFLALATLCAAGCFAPTFHDGQTPCDAQRHCPGGYACAEDNYCWRTGSGPDLGPGGPSGPDMSISDGIGDSVGDMQSPSCVGVICGGVCTDTMTDASNCGACGHSCAPGLCSGGTCQPFKVPLSFQMTSRLRTDGASLYARYLNSVYRCAMPACAGGQQTVVTDPNTEIRYFVFDSTFSHLYYASNGINRCALPGCNSQELVFSTGTDALAIDGVSLYFDNTSNVQSCSLSGPFPCTSPVTLGPPDATFELVSDGTSAYWVPASADKIYSCALPSCGGTPTAIATGLSDVRTLRVFGDKLYWFNYSAASVSNCTPSNCMATLKTFLVGQLGTPGGLDSDGTYLYVGSRTDGSLVGSCMLPDCTGTFTTVVAVQDVPYQMLVLPNYIYWFSTGAPAKALGVAR